MARTLSDALESDYLQGYDEGMDARAAWEVMGAQPVFEGRWSTSRVAGFFTGWEESRGRWGDADRAHPYEQG